MNNLTVLCCVSGAVTGVLCLVVISRFFRGLFGGQSAPASGSQPGGSQSGSIDPTYDDPNIQGHGSFGKRGTSSGLPGRLSSKLGGGQSGRVDSDTVQGRGSFGRDKKD